MILCYRYYGCHNWSISNSLIVLIILPINLLLPAAELEAYTLANGEPTPKSGKQEKFEALINNYLF